MHWEPVKIGDFAGGFGIAPRAVRYYEDLGILPPADRDEGGHRVYGRRHHECLVLILKAKSLGLTLDEVRKIVQSEQDDEDTMQWFRTFVGRRRRLVDEEMARLIEVRKRLEWLNDRLRLDQDRSPASLIDSLPPVADGLSLREMDVLARRKRLTRRPR